MGKFSSGMKKYFKKYDAVFTLDKEERKRLKQESKYTHAEALVTLPARLVLDPLVGATFLVGGVAVGAVAIPVGAVLSKTLFKIGVVALVGGVVVGVWGIVGCPIVNIAEAPYNGFIAFKHRTKHESANEKEAPIEKSSPAQLIEKLGTPTDRQSPESEPPINSKPLFQAQTSKSPETQPYYSVEQSPAYLPA